MANTHFFNLTHLLKHPFIYLDFLAFALWCALGRICRSNVGFYGRYRGLQRGHQSCLQGGDSVMFTTNCHRSCYNFSPLNSKPKSTVVLGKCFRAWDCGGGVSNGYLLLAYITAANLQTFKFSYKQIYYSCDVATPWYVLKEKEQKS